MGKLIWVVGASTGIGFELTQQLLDEGHNVIASARNIAPLEILKAEFPDQLTPLSLDVSDGMQVATQCEQLAAKDRLPDVVIVNAGIYSPVSAKSVSEETALRIMDVNYLGPVRMTEHLLPHMMARGAGHFVYVSSIAGYIGLPKSLAYGPSKAALINFAEGLRIELEGTGVKVQLVNPGFVRTPLTAGNKFKMPFLMEVEDAAERIRSGIKTSQFEIKFPRRFTYMLRTIQMLPYALSLKLLSARTKR